MTKIVSALNLKIPPRDLKAKDTRQLLNLIFTQWLSLSTCIIQAAIDIIPAPPVAQSIRIPKMLYPDLHEVTVAPKNKLEEDLYAGKAEPRSYVTAYVSKMFAVSSKDLPEKKKRPLTAEEMRAKAKETRAARLAEQGQNGVAPHLAGGDSILKEGEGSSLVPEETEEDPEEDPEVVLGFARIYSGVIRRGTTVLALLPKYDATLEPTHPRNQKYVVSATVEGLYIMMGRELVAVDFVRAGNIFAIKGLEGKVYRSATLCAPGEGGVGAGIGELQDPRSWLVNLGAVNRLVSALFCVYCLSDFLS